MSVLNEMALESFDIGLDISNLGVRNGHEIKFCFHKWRNKRTQKTNISIIDPYMIFVTEIQKAVKAMNTFVIFFIGCG